MLPPSQSGAVEFVYPGLESTDSPQPGAAEPLHPSLFMWRLNSSLRPGLELPISLRPNLESTSETLKRAQITTAVLSMNALWELRHKKLNFAPAAHLQPPYL